MPADRERPTLTDYAVTAISPALVMLMVGSLVFFLITVLPTGNYKERLLYSTFFFVFGAVLVARIAIQIDASRATAYGIGLAVVTFLAMSAYVEYPSSLGGFGWLVNIGLLALVWWSAHKLTWDCTHIDEKKEASGRGLLAAAGLDADSKDDTADPFSRDAERSAAPEPEPGGKKRKRKKSPPVSPLWAWWSRYQKHRAAKKDRPRSPGVWVIYFALAALPLFALGQSLIPPADGERRFAAFVQMIVYVGSALGLLVCTSLLGVRLYLRQRKVKVPGAMTASWLGLGAVLIVAFLVLGAFLPRPHSEVPWFGLVEPGKQERDASKYAQLSDGAGKGEGRAGEKSEAGAGNASGKGGQPGGGKSGEKGGGQGDKGSGGGGKDGKSSGGSGKNGGKSGESGGKKGSDSKDGDKSQSGGETNRDAKDADGKSSSRGSNSGGSSSSLGLDKIAGIVKAIVYAVVVVLVVVGVFLLFLGYLAPFTKWARRLLDAIKNWWANLFGGRKRAEAADEEEAVPVVRRPPPFHTFTNPFAAGTADDRDPAELVEYTFAAFDAWAWDRELGREPTETALEFASRVADAFPDLRGLLTQLATLVARLAYSERPLPKNTREVLEQVWEGLVHGAAVGA